MSRIAACVIAVALVLSGALFLVSCGSSGSSSLGSSSLNSSNSGSSNSGPGSSGSSGSGSSGSNAASVTVTVSDHVTCSGTSTGFSHVFVTITDVEAHASSTAGPHDAGWVDLTPNLKQNPMQVDLLAQANSQCVLATLGFSVVIPPGTFQQIRIILAPNNATVSGNKCGSAVNCVMLTSDPDTPHTLLLSSEAKTGIKIPSGQIAGGQFVVPPGQTEDLDIDFMACESIVAEGNGQFRLKPVVHAGQISPNSSSSINGTIIDGATGQPIPGGTTIVALEQKDATGVDRVLMSTLADSTGAFVFCPVPAGTFDVVASAIDGTQNEFGATVITGVPAGSSLGTVPLTKQSGFSTAAATITGQITTSTGSAGAASDISVSALQIVTINNASVLVTIPLTLASAVSINVTTATGACPTNTDCATYTVQVPAANPSVGTFIPGGPQTPAPPDLESVLYTMDARAFVVGGGNAPDCNPADVETSSTSTNTPLIVTAATSVTAATLATTGCQ